ncbi:unnamed protein product [Pieris macdunnoughi]|uniref:G-protein coupled receptors family 1 profile domain-containing protein n=1 Tax=Pieris macdunnoughi TaxID=345717 RepID=A0A821R968_9NEOP|nr:unnamed protein product [Pieris macdunnoughi]
MLPNITFGRTMSWNETNSTHLIPSYLSQEEFFALQNGSDLNSTLNDTHFVLKTWYPSGYSPAHIIIASVVVTVLMIMVVVGNMLVIIAIVTEKALKNIQNWFIASLAVSDFFLGLVIMPFSLANELMGYWIFGFWWCEIHSAMDVLLCTASIMNLCLISLDRYWSITQVVVEIRLNIVEAKYFRSPVHFILQELTVSKLCRFNSVRSRTSSISLDLNV